VGTCSTEIDTWEEIPTGLGRLIWSLEGLIPELGKCLLAAVMFWFFSARDRRNGSGCEERLASSTICCWLCSAVAAGLCYGWFDVHLLRPCRYLYDAHEACSEVARMIESERPASQRVYEKAPHVDMGD
jgi:hypothetical protein